MIHAALQPDRTARSAFILSVALHLLIIFVFNHNDFFRSRLHEATPYYVDLVSLPTADPAPGGSASTAPASEMPVVPASKPAAPQKPTMTLPTKQTTAIPAKVTPPPVQNQREQEAHEFSEKMKRLERSLDARRQSAALAALQKKVADKRGAASAGAPAANGSSIGSDYGAYIQSRLKDALNMTIAFQSSKPEASVRIFIDRNGKLLKYDMVRPSADKLFNNAVIRAIEKAKADFPPVPSGKGFDKLYVFSPQEVQK
jgi:TonB family protein